MKNEEDRIWTKLQSIDTELKEFRGQHNEHLIQIYERLAVHGTKFNMWSLFGGGMSGGLVVIVSTLLTHYLK